MLIFIPTRGRNGNQRTLKNLSPALQKNTVLVADYGFASSLDFYRDRVHSIMELPQGLKGIAYVRQHIMENSPDRYLVMLDDDLSFAVKDTTKNWRIIEPKPPDVEQGFMRLRRWLMEGIVHCGITPRFLNWQAREPWIENSRMMHVLAYDRDAVRELGCSFTNGVTNTFSMDDFHMTLQLLKAGAKNRVDTVFCSNPSASNSAGGASEWRTLQSHNDSARTLADLHAPFVRVSEKQGWQGMDGVRLDVTVQWRKAYQKGGSNGSSQGPQRSRGSADGD